MGALLPQSGASQAQPKGFVLWVLRDGEMKGVWVRNDLRYGDSNLWVLRGERVTFRDLSFL